MYELAIANAMVAASPYHRRPVVADKVENTFHLSRLHDAMDIVSEAAERLEDGLIAGLWTVEERELVDDRPFLRYFPKVTHAEWKAIGSQMYLVLNREVLVEREVVLAAERRWHIHEDFGAEWEASMINSPMKLWVSWSHIQDGTRLVGVAG